MVSTASTAQVRAAKVAMLKVVGVSKCAIECVDVNKGVDVKAAIVGKGKVTVKAVALESGGQPAPLPGRSKGRW